MSTKVSTDSLQQIGELHTRASDLKNSFESEYAGIMQQISDVATGKVGDSTPTPRQATIATGKVAPKRRGRPPGSTNVKAKATATVAAPKKASTPKDATVVAPSQRNYNNDMSLKEAVFDVLDRDNWDGILTLDPDVVSLGASEIKKVIMTEKKWVSASADITSQLAGALGALKTQGLVARENSRYFIPEGVEYSKS
jgi:hypothetical protein